ncbi:MAG: GtrA family protein [Chlorobi bacterium]|nr:GtrA family protein [Chlorobiota bacterium]
MKSNIYQTLYLKSPGFIQKILDEQIIRFTIIGGITASIDYGIMFCLIEFFSINYLIATGIGFIAGSVLNYLLSILWVFERGRYKNQTIEFTLFLLFTLIGFVLNHLVMWVGVDFLYISYMIVKIFSLVVITLFNYLSKKYLVFKR